MQSTSEVVVTEAGAPLRVANSTPATVPSSDPSYHSHEIESDGALDDRTGDAADAADPTTPAEKRLRAEGTGNGGANASLCAAVVVPIKAEECLVVLGSFCNSLLVFRGGHGSSSTAIAVLEKTHGKSPLTSLAHYTSAEDTSTGAARGRIGGLWSTGRDGFVNRYQLRRASTVRLPGEPSLGRSMRTAYSTPDTRAPCVGGWRCRVRTDEPMGIGARGTCSPRRELDMARTGTGARPDPCLCFSEGLAWLIGLAARGTLTKLGPWVRCRPSLPDPPGVVARCDTPRRRISAERVSGVRPLPPAGGAADCVWRSPPLVGLGMACRGWP